MENAGMKSGAFSSGSGTLEFRQLEIDRHCAKQHDVDNDSRWHPLGPTDVPTQQGRCAQQFLVIFCEEQASCFFEKE